MLPVVHVRAADAGYFDLDEDIVGVGEGGDRAVFVGDVEGLVEDEGGVLGGLAGMLVGGGELTSPVGTDILTYVSVVSEGAVAGVLSSFFSFTELSEDAEEDDFFSESFAFLSDFYSDVVSASYDEGKSQARRKSGAARICRKQEEVGK